MIKGGWYIGHREWIDAGLMQEQIREDGRNPEGKKTGMVSIIQHGDIHVLSFHSSAPRLW